MYRQHPQLAAALQAAARGWPVFPLIPGDKRPAIRNWEHRATTDPDRIRRCWSTAPYGIGIATGPAGLVVIDLDTPKADQQPPEQWTGATCSADTLLMLARETGQTPPFDTHTVHTPTGGLHLYYTAPEGVQLRNTSRRLGWLIDTRASGGYVAAPGTLIDGRAYEADYTADPARLPTWLAERLTPSETPPAPAAPVEVGNGAHADYVQAAITAETGRVRDATQGQRNRALYIAACALGQLAAGGSLTPDDVEGVLLGAAHGHITGGAYDTRQARRTIASGLRAGAHRPRQVAA